jgi:hypothetical protein
LQLALCGGEIREVEERDAEIDTRYGEIRREL